MNGTELLARMLQAYDMRSLFHLVTAALPLLKASPTGRVVSSGSYSAHAFRP